MATRIGEMPCINPKCNCKEVSVEITGAGTWQSKCHKCQMPTFGKTGTAWRRHMEELTTLDDAPGAPAHAVDDPKPSRKIAAKPAPAAEPEKLPAPDKKPTNSVFSLGNL